jgi:hypothetical protein
VKSYRHIESVNIPAFLSKIRKKGGVRSGAAAVQRFFIMELYFHRVHLLHRLGLLGIELPFEGVCGFDPFGFR